MAITDKGGIGVAGNKTSGSSLALTTSAATAVGDVVVVQYVSDNIQTTDGETSLVTSVTDSAGNTYTKIREMTFGGGGAAAGLTLSVWYSRHTAALASSSTITASMGTDSTVAKGMSARLFGTSLPVAIDAVTITTNTGTPTSLTLTAPDSKLRLWMRVGGAETKSASFSAATSGWTLTADAGSSGGGGDTTHVSTMADFLVDTVSNSSQTSAPGGTVSCDRVNIFFAMSEANPRKAPRHFYFL